jgi:hypothetical protein
MPIVPAKPLILQDLARCDYFSESQEFFKLISAWSLEASTELVAFFPQW